MDDAQTEAFFDWSGAPSLEDARMYDSHIVGAFRAGWDAAASEYATRITDLERQLFEQPRLGDENAVQNLPEGLPMDVPSLETLVAGQGRRYSEYVVRAEARVEELRSGLREALDLITVPREDQLSYPWKTPILERLRALSGEEATPYEPSPEDVKNIEAAEEDFRAGRFRTVVHGGVKEAPMATETVEICAVCGKDCYCFDCDDTGELPNDTAESEFDPPFKPCPWCAGRHRFSVRDGNGND